MSTQLSLARFREDFKALRGAIYLNGAARSILSDTTMAAIDALLESHRDGSARKEDWDPIGKRCTQRFAELIGAGAHEIAYTKNVSDGINTVARAFPWRRGDNVIVCGDLEHPNNIYPWLNLRALGVEVRLVAQRDDAIDTQAIAAAIDARTRVVSAATVSFTPGFRTELHRLADPCRRRGILLMVDAVQSTGILHLDMAAAGIDALATATSKGLLGLYGLGFLYVSQRWIDRLHPAYLARFSVDQGTAHESEMGAAQFRLQPDARRFEVGHQPWACVAAADASLGQLLALGTPVIEAHATALAERLAHGFAVLGLPLCRTPAGTPASHIVTLGRLGEGGAYSTGDERLNTIAQVLEAHAVRFSVRRGLLRFATHAYSSEDDVDRVLDLARDAVRTRRSA